MSELSADGTRIAYESECLSENNALLSGNMSSSNVKQNYSEARVNVPCTFTIVPHITLSFVPLISLLAR